ncbi:hypothetical protein AB3X91_39830 [Paraburkholderia sp. BR14263]|uniref:hypothetical protein n=1 Tax=unclassified Paraburkholderia TaxID=2615204 RepID=UPI0034CD0FAD
MSKQRKFTATVEEPPNRATAYGFAIHLEDLESDPSFGTHRLVIELQPETTVEQADQLARRLNRLVDEDDKASEWSENSLTL